MSKERMLAFFDGVTAIIITIMVLELRPPHEPTFSALRESWPVFLSYVLSFVYVAIYWNNHHHMMASAERVSGAILWANMHLLFWLSLIPFATAWLGEAHGAGEAAPTAVYGLVLLFSGSAYLLLQRLIVREHGPDSVLARVVSRRWKGKLSLIAYAIAIGLSFWSPEAATVAFAGVALMWLVPEKRIEEQMTGRGAR